MAINKTTKLIVITLLFSLLFGCEQRRTSTTDVKLEDSDKAFMNKVFFDALNGEISEGRREWYNEETGNSGAIVLDSTYLSDTGLYCRRFREEVEIPLGAIPNWFDGRACRNKNNIWVRQ